MKKPNSSSQKNTLAQTDSNNKLVAANYQWLGPLPPPQILGQYEEIIPGSAERIISMAESESSHVKNMEKDAMELEFKENRLGQIFGIITVILSFSTTVACAYLGAYAAAAIVGGSTVVGLTAVFVTGRKYKKQ